MFQRQAREPFPTRNIIFIAILILAFLLFLFRQTQKSNPPSPVQTEQGG